MLLRIAVTASLIALTICQDTCKPPSNQTGLSAYFIYAPRMSESYVGCNMFPNVTIIADSANNTVALGNININGLSQTGGTFTVKVLDGKDPVCVPSFTPDTWTPAMDDCFKNYVSKTTTLVWEMAFSTTTTIATMSAIFYAVPASPTIAPTTPRPVTTTAPPITVTGIDTDPRNVNTDLAVVWVSTGTGNFAQMKNSILDMVTYLTITTDPEATTGTRLSLQSLNKVPSTNTIGVPWEWEKEDFLSAVRGLFTATSPQATWLEGIKAFVASGGFFDVAQANDLGPRKTAQRVFAFFTQTDFSDDYDAIKELLAGLITYDVHMIIIDYSSGGLSQVNRLKLDKVPNLSYLQYKPADPYEFLNKYITTGDNDTSFGCAPIVSSYTLPLTGPVTIPPNYVGPMSTTNGKNGRYCNQMNTWLDFTSTNDPLCFTVDSYELEVEKDWMKIYEADSQGGYIEKVVLNGIEVSQTQFTINSKKARVQFLTDSDTVLGGVTFNVKSGKC